MKLTKVQISGYRSISKEILVHFDPNVTIVLGANDHGKTNLLDALTHINNDTKFDEERDLNWDHSGKAEGFPSLEFEFQLSDGDRELLLAIAQEKQKEIAASSTKVTTGNEPASKPVPAPAKPVPLTSIEPAPPASTPDDIVEPTLSTDPEPSLLTLDDMPQLIQCQKTGLTSSLKYIRPSSLLEGVVSAFMKSHVPRVELIRAHDTVPDSVTSAELASESHEFMRGIFYYAGIDRAEFGMLFSQTDATMMRLEKAEQQLNETLRANWSQGSDLEFRLVHESKTDRIVLRIKDPAVGDRLVRASQRSSGFTHFFTLKTILHARQKEHPANSYVFLFDEPGIYLHPAGQYDLLQVLDTIGKTNQIVYSTHSLFMLNKTFPMRHRLVVKTKQGTTLDGKPHIGRWGSALAALGLSLAGTILFAEYVLLAEGDSDPIYIPAILQKLVALGQGNIDLNAFSAIATENSKNADALIRILLEGSVTPKLAIIVDGDEGGKARLKSLQGLLKMHSIPAKPLLDGTTIEDYLPLVGELYVRAVANYVAKVMESQGNPVTKPDEFRAEFRKSFREAFEEGKVTKGVADWAANAGQKLGKLENPPSKIGIAREYVVLLEETPADKFTTQSLQRPLKLLEWIQELLAMPELREVSKEILQSS